MIPCICTNCQAQYNLKDEFAWKKAKCANCQATFTIPAKDIAPASVWNLDTPIVWVVSEGKSILPNTPAETTPTPTPAETTPSLAETTPTPTVAETTPTPTTSFSPGVFNEHIYGIKQKRLAINEKYYLKNKENGDVFFSIRRVYFWKSLLALITGTIGWIIIGFMLFGVLSTFMPEYIAFPLGILLGLIAIAVLIIFLVPLRHIEFYFKESDLESKKPEFVISQDSRIEIITKNYTLRDTAWNTVATFHKNIFTDILRKKWHLKYNDKHIVIKEDSIILWLLRRFLPYGKLIRTNFIFIDVTKDPKSSDILGYFKRKFELFDNYVLDMSSDIAYSIPRQYAIAMAVLLDTWERR